MLELRLFGSPQVLLNGRSVPELSSAKQQALLFYLALNNRPHARVALAELLWQEKSNKEALMNLRQALSHLRKALPGYLNSNNLTVALNPDLPYQLDVALFEQELQALSRSQSITLRQRAADLYSGEFLAGFYVEDAQPFEEWSVVMRERLHHLATENLQQLVNHFVNHYTHSSQRQESKLGLYYVNRWLALEPWLEEAHRHKLRFLAWHGQRQAALDHYVRCCQILSEELGVEPETETVLLYEEIRKGDLRVPPKKEPASKERVSKEREWTSLAGQAQTIPTQLLHAEKCHSRPGSNQLTSNQLISNQSEVHHPPINQHDWGEIPNVRAFWGRQKESHQIEQWLLADQQEGQQQGQQQVVVILGMGGMGKTTLAAALMPRLAPHFSQIFWRSLLNAPLLSDILSDWIQAISGSPLTTWPNLLDAQLALLFEQLRKQRCLLVLDNVESILSAAGEQSDGGYRPGYADYGQFFLRMGESQHRSCLLLTSREAPPEIARLERKGAAVGCLQLSGLSLDAGQHLLNTVGLVGSIEAQQKLLTRYSGNPLALQLVGKSIQDFFDGEIALFLSDETLLFGDIRQVLDQQFKRLTPLERELLLWLAIEREPVTLPILQQTVCYNGSSSMILEALLTLQQRSLLEKRATGFTLQNVIMEYATTYLVDSICHEIDHEIDHEIETSTPHLLHSHALLKAQAKEYVRRSQARLFLQPISERLQKKWGLPGMVARLKALLDQMRAEQPQMGRAQAGRAQMGRTRQASYAGGNILNLLVHAQASLQQADFSNLTVWQAYLPAAELIDVNFANSDLTNCLFVEQFGVMGAVAFHPNGQVLAAAAANDNKIRFWNLQNGQPLGTLMGHSNIAAELTFSPDGKLLASGSFDHTLCLWDLQNLGEASFQSQQPLLTLGAHEGGVWTVAFSPDGKLLASGSQDQTVRIWDVGSDRMDGSRRGRLLHTLHGHRSEIHMLAFSPDGQLIASGGRDCTVRLWHVASGRAVAQLTGHCKRIWSLIFSPDGRRLASGDWANHIRLWDLTVLPTAGVPETVCVEETSVETSVIENSLLLSGHEGYITLLAFCADGSTLLSGSDDRTLRFWDVRQGVEVARYALQDHPGQSWYMAATKDSNLLAGVGKDCSIRIWDAHNGQLLRRLQGHTQGLLSVAFNHTGDRLAVGCEDHKVRVWDMQTQSLHKVLRGHTDGVEEVAFCPASPAVTSRATSGSHPALLASSSVDQTIRLWDVQSGQLVRTLRGHTNWVRAIALSPDGSLLASASNDLTVRLWSTLTGDLLQTWSIPSEGDWCWAISFSPNGKTLAVGCRNNLIHLWDINTPNNINTPNTPNPQHKRFNPIVWRGHTRSITTLAFHPNGLLLASGSFDQTVRLWDVQSGETVAILQGHEAWVWKIAFSPDGDSLVSASEDQTLCVWDVRDASARGQLRHRLQGHRNGVRGVAFSPDGKTIVSASSDETIKCWESQTGKCLTTLSAPRPYEGMNISGVSGISEAQKATLKTLGAVEEVPI